MKLILEMFLCAREDEAAVCFHCCQLGITDSRKDPGAILTEQLTCLGLLNSQGACYAHSTSWRYEAGRTLLTYLVWVGRQALEKLPRWCR